MNGIVKLKLENLELKLENLEYLREKYIEAEFKLYNENKKHNRRNPYKGTRLINKTYRQIEAVKKEIKELKNLSFLGKAKLVKEVLF